MTKTIRQFYRKAARLADLVDSGLSVDSGSGYIVRSENGRTILIDKQTGRALKLFVKSSDKV